MENASMYNAAEVITVDEYISELESIVKKIDQGYYEHIDPSSSSLKLTPVVDMSNSDRKFDIGKSIDVYREDVGIWYTATITGIETKQATDVDGVSIIMETYVKIRYNGWGIDPRHDELISITSKRIAPFGIRTEDLKYRYESPDEIPNELAETEIQEKKTWPCPFCGKVYNSDPGWRYHIEENKCKSVEERAKEALPRSVGIIIINIIIIIYYRRHYHQVIMVYMTI
jgi:hypothetical protein